MSNLNDLAAMGKGETSAETPLSELLSRSQTDFELDFYSRIAAKSPLYVDVLIQLAQLLTQKKCHAEALEVDRRLSKLRPNDPTVVYNLACSYSLLGRANEALGALRRAIQLGYWDVDHLLIDPDLSNLHDVPEFQSLLEALDFQNG